MGWCWKQSTVVAQVTAHFHFFHVRGLDVVLLNQAQHFVHHLLLNRAAREPLDQVSGRDEHPRFSQLIHDNLRIEAAADGEEPQLRFQNIRRGGPADRRKVRGDRSVFARMAGVKRLGH